MKVAITYEHGMIFQHFGKCQNFLILDIQENKVTNRNLWKSNGSGHGALVAMLSKESVDVLICGGIGQGALHALQDAKIQVIAGAVGNVDVAVDAYLNGTLHNDPKGTCDHHHEGEHHHCSHDHCH